MGNKDAWKRRSIFLTKAQAFEPHSNQESRHTVMNNMNNKPFLHRDDSTDDELWDNVDENIGEFDRVIPSIAQPKCMQALLDIFQLEGINNLLRNSTRFSISFHVGGNSLKNKESSFRGSKFDSSRKANRKEENKMIEKNTEGGFNGYQNFSEVHRQDTLKADDCNFTEEQWVREKSLKIQRESLKNDPIKRMTNIKNGLDEQNEIDQIENDHDLSIRKIEELDDKKKAISEITMKPKKNLNSMVSKVVSPFATAPSENKKRHSNSEKITRNNSNTSSNEDRASLDQWRASEDIDRRGSDMANQQQNNNNNDVILDQWLKRGDSNGTILEDVEAENQTESNRMSKASILTASERRPSEIEQVQHQEEEEENEPQNISDKSAAEIHMVQSLQALQYMKTVVVPAKDELRDKFVFLPPHEQSHTKKTLIFDMDETLIHCVDDIELEKPQVVLDVEFEDGEVVEAGINVRPFAIDCLKAANELFQVIVFTASHK
eukprot:CAMPEP_0205807058 /NCGR_PEP_ID=MMETSP0205-20121125/10729_1 /ASSEMBLY_ACC=CAM_ASM_000278 /TAXON_ID=36767 /ORGANISM="Euplotes focardii, Strain TN1" /LENGTH=490 /DNA_ID=CAMNT_0053080791 /DNA_START=66 /DNA_END=1538 /DNA_ORIENTATION=-